MESGFRESEHGGVPVQQQIDHRALAQVAAAVADDLPNVTILGDGPAHRAAMSLSSGRAGARLTVCDARKICAVTMFAHH